MIFDFEKIDFKNAFIEKAIEILLDERCSGKVLEKLENIINSKSLSLGAMRIIFTILEKKKRNDIIEKWSKLENFKMVFDSSLALWPDQEEWNKYDIRLLELTINSFENTKTPQSPIYDEENELLNISALYNTMGIGKTPAGNYFDIINKEYSSSFSMVVIGTTHALNISPDLIISEAKVAINRLLNGEKFSLFSMLSNVDANPDWERTKNMNLDSRTLAYALDHPNMAISITAANLILAKADTDDVLDPVKAVLNTGRSHTLYVISQIADKIWKDQALDIILNRLDKKIVPGCQYLLDNLPTFVVDKSDSRIYQYFLKNFTNPNVDISMGAVKGYSKYQPISKHKNDIRNALSYWEKNEKPYPVSGGTIPDSPRKELIEILVNLKDLNTNELVKYCADVRSDVKDASINALIRIFDSNTSELLKVIELIKNNDAPINILSKLHELSVETLQKIKKELLSLLESDSADIRIEGLKILRSDWIKKEEAEMLIKKYIEDSNPNVRDQAFFALQRINSN